ncbi:insulin-like peptide INSL5 [Manis javanica]|uniref:insulin-like peptide INSL5 n=1 Tax=Manis javanica TaxID=9974 RepID=UPI0008131592|nr:insulin-like peptide INSL5 [Manis javanica]KAI5938038.1 Insulin-like peptide INSL5 [Manis javanica]
MKGSIFTVFLVSVLLAVSEVQSEESLKLCGLEFVRTVIYICASSRWRRHLGGTPEVQQAKPGNYFQLPNEREVSVESTAQNLPKMDSSGEESLQDGELPINRLWRSKNRSVMSRQDVQTLCCAEGCSLTDLSGFC